MYEQIVEEFEDVGVAERLDVSAWMDKVRKRVDKHDNFSCKVTHNIMRLDMCLLVTYFIIRQDNLWEKTS